MKGGLPSVPVLPKKQQQPDSVLNVGRGLFVGQVGLCWAPDLSSSLRSLLKLSLAGVGEVAPGMLAAQPGCGPSSHRIQPLLHEAVLSGPGGAASTLLEADAQRGSGSHLRA